MTVRTVHNAKRSEAQVSFIRTMLATLDPFFRIRTAIPARCVQAFFLVAEKEGLSVAEYAKRAGMSPTTMSRNLLDLGERDRKFEEGAGLVEGRDNVLNLREKIYTLSPKGRALLTTIMGRVK